MSVAPPRHVVPHRARTAYPHLTAEFDVLDETLAAAHSALTGPDTPDPVVTLHTGTRSEPGRPTPHHWSETCTKYPDLTFPVPVTRAMSEVSDQECLSCRANAPALDELERFWTTHTLWEEVGQVLEIIGDGYFPEALDILQWSVLVAPRHGPGHVFADAAAAVTAALYALTEAGTGRIRTAAPARVLGEPTSLVPDASADVTVRRDAAILSAAARMASRIRWTRSPDGLTYTETAPEVTQPLRRLGIDPGAEPERLAAPYRAWLDCLSAAGDFTAAAAAAVAAYGPLPSSVAPLLDQPATRQDAAERELAGVFDLWMRGACEVRDRFAQLGLVDVALPGFGETVGPQAVAAELKAVFPVRYDVRARAETVTVPAVVAAWLDWPLTEHRYTMRIVAARGDTPEVVFAFGSLRGPARDVHRHFASGGRRPDRMSVEDALVAARAVNDVPLNGATSP